MLKKRWIEYLSIAFISLGAFIVLFLNSSLTGFIILNEFNKTNGSFLGLFFIIGGIIFIAFNRSYQGNLESKIEIEVVPPDKFAERFFTKESVKERRSIILDTSAILSYQPQQIVQLLKKFGEVYIPNSVLNEVKNPQVRRLLEDFAIPLKGYEDFRTESRNILEQTEKPQLRNFLLPYLSGAKEIETRRESSEISNKTNRIRKIMEREGWTFDDAKNYPEIAVKKIVDYLNINCDVSVADIDVLAMGLYRSSQGHHALIGERDIDLREAINILKKSNSKYGKNLDYVEPYITSN